MRAALLGGIVSFAMVSAVPAWAQPGAAPSEPAPPDPAAGAVAPMPPPPPPGSQKSTGLGIGLGIAGSILPVLAFEGSLEIDNKNNRQGAIIMSVIAGLALPSIGVFYAGSRKPYGTYPRAAALLALSIGALVEKADNSKGAEGWYVATGVLYGIGCGVDLIMTPSTVNAHNRKAAGYAIGPMLLPGGGGIVIGGEL